MTNSISKDVEYDGLFLNIDNTVENKVTVHVKGRLETANSIHFLDYMIKLVDSTPAGSELILAMSELYYVSSTGIGAFTTILVNSKKRSIRLYIKDMQPKVKDVLDLLGFSSFFNFC